jgi:Rv2175c C-terminal domain of unknown function
MELLTFPAVADALRVPVNRIDQYVRDGHLVAVRNEAGARCVPAEFVQDGAIVKSLHSVITMLRDARFADEEIIEWLFREDDSLAGCPIELLRANRGSQVKRFAQVAGY